MMLMGVSKINNKYVLVGKLILVSTLYIIFVFIPTALIIKFSKKD